MADATWPTSFEQAHDSFGRSVCETLSKKGWCLVDKVADASLLESAAKEATKARGFEAPKEEFVKDFMGQSAHGRVAWLQTEIPDDYTPVKEDAISAFDRDLSNLATALAPLSYDILGFPISDRYPGMLWVPFTNKRDRFDPESLNEDDVEDGTIEAHLSFLKRRNLCFFNMISNEGGDLKLLPKEGSGLAETGIPVASNKLLVFRSDMFSFSFEPTGKHVTLLTWTLGLDPINDPLVLGVTDNFSQVLGIDKGAPMPAGDRVKILSMMARYPGAGFGPMGYATMLRTGTDAMIGLLPSRWDPDIYCTKETSDRIPGLCYSRHGGFCKDDEIYTFDNEFFDICVEEATHMSPSQRNSLEDSFTSCYLAGYTKETLSGKPIGVFLGDTGSDWVPFHSDNYAELMGGDETVVGPLTPYGMTGAFNSVTCARLSTVCNLSGPIATADTACSSSLVGMGVAMAFLRPRAGEVNMYTQNRYREAVAQGVCTQIGPFTYIGMCALSMISPLGRCFTFEETADGYARGEGTGTIFLRSSTDEKDAINQLGCLLASAVNQDGRSASMTAPNGPSQTAAIVASMREAQVKASQIDIAECHGTGTALGDPIEVGALRAAMEPRDTSLSTCSAKCHIGHLEGGAGIAGVCKCLTMLRAACITPNQHLRQLNANFTLAGFPLQFSQESCETGLNASLTGVSSFGFGGTNGRSDLWGVCRTGNSHAGVVDKMKMDQLYVKCPITMGSIDYLSGEPLMDGVVKKYMADVLRDEFADYGVSTFVYDGGFRFRASEVQEDADAPLGKAPYICGSWSNYEMQAMTAIEPPEPEVPEEPEDTDAKKEEDEEKKEIEDDAEKKDDEEKKEDGDAEDTEDKEESKEDKEEALEKKEEKSAIVKKPPAKPKPSTFWTIVKLGEARYETFTICLDKSTKQALYPAVDKGKAHIFVKGPSESGGKQWIIDGRDAEVPAGTAYKVTLRNGTQKKTITWEEATEEDAKLALSEVKHTYFVVGSWTRGKPVEMKLVSPGTFAASLSLGMQGKEDFYFVRDEDMAQAIYPAKTTCDTGVPARGPDDLRNDKTFFLRGAVGEKVTLTLSVVDAKVTVTAASDLRAEKVWTSEQGWARHSYSVAGSFNEWTPAPMAMAAPGIFKFSAPMGTTKSEAAFGDVFQVYVDDDPSLAFAPEVELAPSGSSIVAGPGVAVSKGFNVRSATAMAKFEVTLDLTTVDRRKTVTWALA